MVTGRSPNLSSLIFHTDETQAFIATDTLAVASHDKRPVNFTTKAFIVPHLRMIIAGTGVGGFLDEWFVKINGKMVTLGIDNLNEHTPRNLASIWCGQKEKVGYPNTTTVYHFGFSERTGLIHSYAYRSTTGFASEKLDYGLAHKPDCTVPDDYRLPDDLKVMMDDQRRLQKRAPKAQRIYIGGEIQVHHLTSAGYQVFTHYRFEDYEQDQKIMLGRESSM